MNAAIFRPSFSVLTSKLFWIRTNRVLAWSLIGAPVLQIALGSSVIYGLMIETAIILAHGVLSLILFGKPETRDKVFVFTMHVMGFRERDMSERNRFLLTGYRLAATILGLLLNWLVSGPVSAIMCTLMFYPMLRTSISFIQHIYNAVLYAFKRWGMRRYAKLNAVLLVAVYLLLAVTNVTRG